MCVNPTTGVGTTTNMNKRPWFVTIVGWLFIVVGIVGIVYHANEFNLQAPFDYDLVWALFVRLLAIVSGTFLLRGANWARWLLISWLVYHVILRTMHSVPELVMHIVFLASISYVLLRPQMTEYFRSVNSQK